MSGNTSATGGLLVPAATPAPLEDDALDTFFQAWVAGITGLDGTLVRPRWQPTPLAEPPVTTTWAAVGVTDRTPDANPVIVHQPAGQGADQYQRHEVLEVTVSVYGSAAASTAAQLRDGVYVAQNREPLSLAGMGLVEAGPVINAPDLVNGQWRRRCDITLRVRRQIVRVYPVLNLESAGISVATDQGITAQVAVHE